MTFEAIWATLPLSLLIFGLRVLNSALFTIRMILTARQRTGLSTVLAFLESLIFAYTVTSVVNDLNNWLLLGAYCGGFALGSYLGLVLERRLITSYIMMDVYTPTLGHDIAEALRADGHGVTETTGVGRDGAVDILRVVANRKEVARILEIVYALNPHAFVATNETRSIAHGTLRSTEPRWRPFL